MVKLVSLMKRKPELSREQFAHWAVTEHSPLGLKLPGIRRYHISVLRPDQPETEFDGVFEMWFDTMDALQKALDSPAGAAAREDAMAHAEKRIHLRTDEHPILK
jgi:uncharacterized protein (TIGR02118 family)